MIINQYSVPSIGRDTKNGTINGGGWGVGVKLAFNKGRCKCACGLNEELFIFLDCEIKRCVYVWQYNSAANFWSSYAR